MQTGRPCVALHFHEKLHDLGGPAASGANDTATSATSATRVHENLFTAGAQPMQASCHVLDEHNVNLFQAKPSAKFARDFS